MQIGNNQNGAIIIWLYALIDVKGQRPPSFAPKYIHTFRLVWVDGLKDGRTIKIDGRGFNIPTKTRKAMGVGGVLGQGVAAVMS